MGGVGRGKEVGVGSRGEGSGGRNWSNVVYGKRDEWTELIVYGEQGGGGGG